MWPVCLIAGVIDRILELSVTVLFTRRNILLLLTFYRLILTRWVPVEGKSPVCLICMKYRIIILIIIIISLGQILLSYIANTSCTHALAHAQAHTHTAIAAIQVSTIRWRPTVTARSTGIHSWLPGHSNNHTRWPPDFPEILDVFRV